LKEASNSILQGVLNDIKEVVLKNSVRIKIAKVGEKGSYVGFSTHDGGAISPEQVIYKNIKDNLVVADKQLLEAVNKGKKGIVLLANRYVHANYLGHIYGGLSLGIEKLIQLKNIHEIWFEHSEKKFTYEMVYEKSFFENIIQGVKLDDKNHFRLLENWIYHLNAPIWPYQPQLFQCLQNTLKEKRPDELFYDRFARQQMVQIGKSLAEKGDYNKVIWLIEKFKDDSHPSTIPVVGERDYEQEILQGGTQDAITSVVGQVVWLVKELAWKQELIGTALVYISDLVQHRSFYIKTHCGYALQDISNNRVWLKGFGKYPRVEEYQKFHEIVFYLLDIVKKHPSCIALVRRLTNIFESYCELTEAEALDMLETLSSTTESADLYIYYALYRHQNFNELGYKFDPTEFIKRLKGLIANKDLRSTNFRPALAQSFWRTLSHKPSEFFTLRPYIVMLFDCEYEQELFPRLRPLLEEIYKIDKKLGFDLYAKSFETLFNNFKNANSSNKIHFWFDAGVLIELAKTHFEGYVEIVKKIADLWEKGGNFGHLTNIFLPYKEISDPDQRDRTRIELAQIYLRMLNLSPFINNQVITSALKIEEAEFPIVKTEIRRIDGVLSDILKTDLITSIDLPKRIANADDEGDNVERSYFLYQNLFGKITQEISTAFGRYLSPTEIEFISERLKIYIKNNVINHTSDI
jgi:hypothetical protein